MWEILLSIEVVKSALFCTVYKLCYHEIVVAEEFLAEMASGKEEGICILPPMNAPATSSELALDKPQDNWTSPAPARHLPFH